MTNLAANDNNWLPDAQVAGIVVSIGKVVLVSTMGWVAKWYWSVTCDNDACPVKHYIRMGQASKLMYTNITISEIDTTL